MVVVLPASPDGVKLIQEDDSASKRLSRFEHLHQQLLALAIPLGHNCLQGEIDQWDCGLRGQDASAGGLACMRRVSQMWVY